MQIGVSYANFTHPDWKHRLARRLTETARVADQGGIAQFTVMDHWFQMEQFGGPPEPMLEGYTTLGYLAAVTEHLRLSLLVTGVTYRHPGLLAKTVTTLDVLSGGRAMLGIGTGWYEREHLGLGVPFPPLTERYERLEETLQIARQFFADDQTPYAGTHYTLKEPINVPLPAQRMLPIMIGGSGERKTLRLVAQYADACNLFGDEPDVVGHKLNVLRGHCDDAGTDYDAIEKTMITRRNPTQDPDAFLASMRPYADLGISMITMAPVGDDPVAWTTSLAQDVVPRLAEL